MQLDSIRQQARSLIKTLGWTIFPGQCVLCLMPSHRKRDLCLYCENDLPWLQNCCEICGFSEGITRRKLVEKQRFSHESAADFSGTGNRNISVTCTRNLQDSATKSHRCCAVCRSTARLSPITRVVAPLAYASCAAALVQQQKERNGAVAARVLAELLGDAILTTYHPSSVEPMPSLLIPVPLHWRREWQRGHNQSTLLATHLSNRLQLPIGENIAQRTRATRSQQQLDIKARSANMHNAFSINLASRSANPASAHPQLHNARVAIIDDVVTTGATARALAAALCRAGAAEIHLWSPTRAILSGNRTAATLPLPGLP